MCSLYLVETTIMLKNILETKMNYKALILLTIEVHGPLTPSQVSNILNEYPLRYRDPNYWKYLEFPRLISNKMEAMRKKRMLEWHTPYGGHEIPYRLPLKINF